MLFRSPDLVKVAMVTEHGTIELELDHKHAPLTTENFVRYVDSRRFDGAVFYRVMRLKWGEQPNGLVQAGLQGNHGVTRAVRGNLWQSLTGHPAPRPKPVS